MHGLQWVVFGHGGILGRIIDRGVHVWYSELFLPERLRALAMDITNMTTVVALQNYAARLEHRQEVPPLVGNRHFYTSDFQVHRRANWTAALKMHSIRTTATECDNFENLKGEHIGDGVLNLYTRNAQYSAGEEYENIFALLDWQLINGITVESDVPLLPCVNSQFAMQKTKFVGGVSDGYYGAAMMDTATHNLTAKRTWHFYDHFIMALATDIQDNSSALLTTTLASRLLPAADTIEGTVTIQWSNGTQQILPDGTYTFLPTEPRLSWFHTDGTTWIVLGDYAALTIDCRNKSGNVNQIGPWDFQMQGRLFTAAIVHGRGPTSQALNYTYMIIPNVTLSDMTSLWNRYVSLVNNAYTVQQRQYDDTILHLHGACDSSVQRASVLLFDDASTAGHGVYYNCTDLLLSMYMEQAGAFLYSENADNFTITAAHPTLAQGTLAISVNRESINTSECIRDTRWQSQPGTQILLKLPGTDELLGMSISVTCQKKSN